MVSNFTDDVVRELQTRSIRPSDETVADLAASCRTLEANGGVDRNPVTFSPEHWVGVLDVLPDRAREEGIVSRGDVRSIGKTAVADRRPLDLLAAVYIWGQGRNGYGRTRYDRIMSVGDQRVEDKLGRAIDHLLDAGPIDAYAQLWGGDGSGHRPTRASANNNDWCRIDSLGPAFFTKILYFADRDALILDQVLARRVSRISGLPHFVAKRGRAIAWSPYRYAVYLEWMRRMAAVISEHQSTPVTTDLLELALFKPSTAPEDEGNAAN